jgi:Ca2+-binding RTX toxin-like protein
MRYLRREALLIAALLVAGLPSTVEAATPKCFGHEATILGSGRRIVGTRKADVIFVEGQGNFVWGGGGDDLICGNRRTNQLYGEGGDDKLASNGGGDSLYGGLGDDLLKGAADGLQDSANYEYAAGPIQASFKSGVATGEGRDRFREIEFIFGSPFDDRLIGDDRLNYFAGLDGDDYIDAKGGFDYVQPGLGDDTVIGGEGRQLDLLDANQEPNAVTVDLEAGTSTGAGTDRVIGFEGAIGSAYDDTIVGSDGDDFLFGGPGDDSIDGRGGFDYAVYLWASGPVNVNLETSEATGAVVMQDGADVGEGNDSLTDLEGILGSQGYGDILVGDEGDNYLDGDGGADTVDGGGGDDWIFGGEGLPGDDVIDGGPGDYDFWDFYRLEKVTADLSSGIIDTKSEHITITGVEGIGSNNRADILVGDENDNYFFGWGGNDNITGGGGDDQISGGEGVDEVDAGTGFDICAEVEQLLDCDDQVSDVDLHPLQAAAETASAFRRNF